MSIASLCDVDNYQKVITWVEFLVFFSSEKYCFGEIFYQKANSYSEFIGGLTAVERGALRCTHKSRVSNLVFPLPVELVRS